MAGNEKVHEFASSIRQLAGTLKLMGVTIEESEIAKALPNVLPDRFDGIISALNSLGNDEKLFTFEVVQQRHSTRDEEDQSNHENAVLFASPNICVHCSKNDERSRRYKMYSIISPPYWPSMNSKALFFRQKPKKSEFSIA